MGDISSLLASADKDMPKVKRKGSKYVVEGDEETEYGTYEEAIKGAARMDAGPTMTAGNPDETSALSDMDFAQGQKDDNPNLNLGSKQEEPPKPDWVVRTEKASGSTYEFDGKHWRPSKKKPFTGENPMPPADMQGRM